MAGQRSEAEEGRNKREMTDPFLIVPVWHTGRGGHDSNRMAKASFALEREGFFG